MRLSRRQSVALKRSRKTINIWSGSVRSSKTFASLWDFVQVMLRRRMTGDREGVVLVVAHSTNSAWRNIFQPLLTHPEFAHVAPHLAYRRNAPTGTLFGQEFSVVGANNETSWLAIQGLTVAYCLGDEAVSWPESFWDMLVTRLSMPTSRCLVTCNPGAPTHYLKRLIDSGDPDVHHEVFLLDQNPTLDAGYIARLKRQFSGVFYRRMILALWESAEGAIYERWDHETMTGTPPRGDVLCVGLDYGTQNPSAGVALMVGDDGRLWISHEWAPNPGDRRMTDSELADSLQEWLGTLPNPPRFIYTDPAAASFREELRRRGVITHKADNSVVPGVQTVDSLLVSGGLMVAEQCEHLIRELPAYRWDAKAAARGVDAPVKENDHHVDALRYAIRSSRHLWGRLVQSAAA